MCIIQLCGCVIQLCVYNDVSFNSVRLKLVMLVRVWLVSLLGVIGDRVRVGVYVVFELMEYIVGGGVCMSEGSAQ